MQAFLAENLGWLNTPIPLFHMVCTNVPGPQIPLYTCGQRMTACYPHVPTGMDVGISVAIESYDGKLYFALTTDALAALDGVAHDRLSGSPRSSELRAAAGVPRERSAGGPQFNGLRAKTKATSAQDGDKRQPDAMGGRGYGKPRSPDVTTLLGEAPLPGRELGRRPCGSGRRTRASRLMPRRGLLAALVLAVGAAQTPPSAPAAGSISGVVKEAASHMPMEGVRVYAGGASASTGPLGEFTLSALEPGQNWVSVYDHLHAGSGGVHVLLNAGQQLTGVEIFVKSGGSHHPGACWMTKARRSRALRSYF